MEAGKCEDEKIAKKCAKTCDMCEDEGGQGGKCKDKMPAKKCKKMMEAGKCEDKKIAKQCQKTCDMCEDVDLLKGCVILSIRCFVYKNHFSPAFGRRPNFYERL